MSNHRVHAILEATFEVHELSRRQGFTTVDLEGTKGGPFRETCGEPAASILMDVVDPCMQARLELLQPGQKLKMYLELEHPYAPDSLTIEQERPPILYMKDYNLSATPQTTGQLVAIC